MTIEALMANEQFLQKLYQASDLAEVMALFKEEGVAVSEEQILASTLPAGDDLSEKDLESVSGGGSVMSWFRSRLGGGRGAAGGGGSMGGR